MKKFNVPTKLDCILQLITSHKRKPHLFMLRGNYVAEVIKGHRMVRLSYNPLTGMLIVSLPNFRDERTFKLLLTWSEIYFWAKRVDGNRWKWDK